MTVERPIDEAKHPGARKGPVRPDRGAFGQDAGQSTDPWRLTREPGPVPWWLMVLCALAVGVIAGLGAVVFRAMIGGFHNLLFLGATLGGCFGSALLHFFPDLPMTPAHFAYAGMAGMVGGSTGAVFTGTIMIFEMTRDYTTILSVILAVALACATRNWLSFSTIYTSKLLRRGEMAPQGLQARVGENKSQYFMTKDFVVLSQDQADEPEVVRRALLHGQVVVVTGPGNRIIGLIDERSRLETSSPEEGIYVAVDPEMPLNAVLRAIDAAGARLALVVNQAEGGGQEVLGVITERAVSRLSHAIARLAD